MPTSFHQCLGIKPCFETNFPSFPSKVSLQDIFFCCVKSYGSKYNFCDLLWLTVNLGVISMVENIRSIEMDNY